MATSAELVRCVRCPTCGDTVEIAEDGLRCHNDHLIPLRDGYLDVVGTAQDSGADNDTTRTANSFGYEWTTFDAIEAEDAEYWKMYFRDVPVETYAGKVALDAGCGKGRYSLFTAAKAKALAAVDNSEAVEAATRNLKGLDNVMVLKADLRSLPFAPESFEFVSCLGVLHHLRDPEAGFGDLVALLQPGGHFLLYVYSADSSLTLRTVGLAAAAQLRRLTVRLPHRLLRAVSAPLAALLYGGLVVPGTVGTRLRIKPLTRLPLATYRGMPVRSLWLDTFDRLSAPIEHRYNREQVESWFKGAGLAILASREEAGLFVFGRKPD